MILDLAAQQRLRSPLPTLLTEKSGTRPEKRGRSSVRLSCTRARAC